jgi:hypothetical protein
VEKNTGTIFKVYLLDKTKDGKQEGMVQLWSHKGERQAPNKQHFDYLDEFPRKVRKALRDAKIQWPPVSKNRRRSS